MWTAAILAGGQARRLGGLDKSALAVGAADSAGNRAGDGGQAPRSILEHQLAVLRDLTPHILIVTRDDAPAARQAGHAGVVRVRDRVADAGALGGLYTALVEAPTEQVLVIACDMPFVTAPFLARLATLGASGDVDAVVPRDAHGRHPLCASYHRRTAAAIRARIDAGQLRVLDALEAMAVREVGPEELAAYDHDGRLLLNVNTPEDHAKAQLRSAYHE
jgi:molybdopterin-guanine dinucleotide biosynthesis protein A